MRLYIFLAFLHLSNQQLQNEDLIDTLKNKIHELKLKQLKEVITPNFRSKFIGFHEENYRWKSASGVSMFSQDFIMLENDFYSFNSFENFHLKTVAKIIEGHDRISTVELVEFGNIAIMMLILNKQVVKVVKFESGKNQEFNFQNVQDMEHISVSDAKMFRVQNRLFMGIANDKGSNIAPFSLYEWAGGSFYEKSVLTTQGIPQIEVFEHDGRAIILMLHKKNELVTICDVFEYEDEKLNKLQELKLEGPRHIIPYEVKDDKYVLVFSAWRRHLFSWSGERLVQISSESTNNNDYQKVKISKINNVTLVFASKHHEVDIFMMSAQGAIFLTTQNYLHTFVGILSVDHFKINGTDYLVVTGNVGLSGTIEYFEIELTGIPEIGDPTPTSDPLANCLGLLHGELEVDSNNSNSSVKYYISPQKGASESKASYMRQSNTIEEIENLLFDEDIEDIDGRTMDLMNITADFKTDGGEMEINGDIVVEGKIIGKELTVDSLELQLVNEKKWSPNQWLSYTKNQTIAGGKDAENLIVKELLVTAEIDLLKDLLLNNSDVKIAGIFTIDNLITNKMIVDEINNIRMEDVFMRGRDDIIKGTKTITNLKSNSIEALSIQKPNAGMNNIINGIRFAPHVYIDDLTVKYIDGVEWDTFADSVFRYGVTEQISGNIRMKAFDAERLFVKNLNGVDTANLMTKTTDQTVNSTIDIEQTHIKNYMAVNSINDLNPSDIVTITDPSVEGPVSIQKIRLLGKLVRNYNTSDKEHPTVGTKESDLVQFYHNVIKIEGNLRLKNFRNLDSLKIIVGEEHEEFNPNFPEKYWMKHVNQVIPVHVHAKGGVKTPHLQTRILNQNNFNNFLLNNSIEVPPTNFDFENVTFLGNIHLSKENTQNPNLERINSEAVRNNGSFLIQGKKVFQDTLKIHSLIADELNGMDKKSLITKSQPLSFNGSVIFQNLVVNGNLNSKSFTFDELNGIKLDDLKKNTVYIDRPQELNNLSFTSITANHLDIENINGRPVDEYLAEANDAFNISVIDRLIINGKLAIGNLSKLSKINDKHPNLVFANRFKLDDQGVFHGNVRFLNDVTIDQLGATFVNGIDFRNLVNSIFYRSGNQTIPAKFTFENLKTKHLVAPKINEHDVDPLVDIKSNEVQKIIAFKGATFKTVDIAKLYAEKISPCDITAFNAMTNPLTQSWSRITVHGNVTIMDEENPLHDIFENAVLLNTKNIISAPVYFKNISAENVDTNEFINNVNLTRIFSDALLKKSKTPQIVSGINFIEQLNITSATVYNDSDITVVNGVDFPDIFSRIIPKGAINIMPITGKKTFFAGLQTERLQSEIVSNVVPEQIVTVDKIQNVTSATFESIELKKMSVDYVNGQDFQQFINERVLLDGPPIQELQGFYTFQDIHILGNVQVAEINEVDIQDVVFDIHNQTIGDKKTFVNDVYIHGNVNINMLNGRFISEIYQKALLKSEESFIDSNVKIMRPSYANGTIITESINGYPLEDIRRCLNSGIKEREQQEINAMVSSMEESAFKSYQLIERMSSEIMYIEKSNDIQLSLENVLDAQVFRLKDYVLIHIIGEGEGTLCQLPKSCKCPVQYTVQISPENSINTFFSKGSQRVYSYDDKKMTVHLITNSVSTGAICRRNSTKGEVSSLSWNTAKEKNNTGTMFSETIKFTGYISAVEFFTVNGATYAIIGKYYDPEKNSYNLDSIVYKFNEDRTGVSEIQRIETNGLWSLKIFYTPQGVVLILGMLGDKLSNQNSEKTLIMRFNQDVEKFIMLREVKVYGCSSAVGILLESENFIALSHKMYPVLIFKYDHLQDNYVYYQHLWDSSPIRGISLFYSGQFGRSEPYLCVTSKRGMYSIYTYQYIKGWQRKFFSKIEGLRNLVPFELNDKLYLFALSTNVSSVLTVVRYRSD